MSDLGFMTPTANVKLSVESDQNELELTLDETAIGGTSDYTKLKNKPTLNGKTIVGDMWETDPTVPDWAKATSKPTYSADEIGAVQENSVVSIAELAELF